MGNNENQIGDRLKIHIFGLTVKSHDVDYNYEFCSANEDVLLSLKNFLDDLHQHDLFLPKDVFHSFLDDMECFVFDPEKQDKDKIKFETLTRREDENPPSLKDILETLTRDLDKHGLELSKKTRKSFQDFLSEDLSEAFEVSAHEETPDAEEVRQKRPKKGKPKKAALEIGKHKSGKSVHRLLKRASMHYWSNIGGAGKSALYEGASNSPTFYMAMEQPTPNIMQAAYAGGALTASFVGESGLNAWNLMKCLKLEDEFQENSQAFGQDEALITLENKMHKEGLLFEGLSEQNLGKYPEKKFNNIIEGMHLFTEQGYIIRRVKDVSNYLRENKVEAAKKAALAPLKLLDGVRKLTISTTKLAGTLLLDIFLNPLEKAYHKNIATGAFRIAQTPFTYKLFRNELRHKEKQKPHFVEITNGKDTDSLVAKSDDAFTEELRKTQKSVHNSISGSRFETGRYGLESWFIGGHVAEVAHCANNGAFDNLIDAASRLDVEAFANGDVFTGDTIKCLVSIGSISLALEPWAHLGKNLDNLHKKITGQRSKQAAQHDRYLQLMDTLEARQEKEDAGTEEKKQGDPEKDTDQLSL